MINNFMLDNANGPVVRFLQDARLGWTDGTGRNYRNSFQWSVGDWVCQIGKMTDKQRAALASMMEKKAWVEPPRFNPFVEVTEKLYILYVCPGRAPTTERIAQHHAEAVAHGLKPLFTVGGMCEQTTDPLDPELDPTPAERRRGKISTYVTPLYRMLAKAEAAGALVAEPSDTSSVST